jgi:azurin
MPEIPTRDFTRRSLLTMVGLTVGSAVLVACGGASAAAQPAATSSAAETAQPEPTDTPSPNSEAQAAQAAASGAVVLEIGTSASPTEFKFDKATLEAPAGSRIALKLSNNTKLKDEVGHNWVLVKPGQEASVVANGNTAGDGNDWLKPDDPGVIAHTALIEGEKSDTITFDAPPAGTYTYLSTFPKQYDGGMKGTLTIK